MKKLWKQVRMIKQVIKTVLWVTSIVCLYVIVTTRDPRGFGLVTVVGFLCTWILIKWDKFEEHLDD